MLSSKIHFFVIYLPQCRPTSLPVWHIFVVQLLSHVWLFVTHGLQHTRLPVLHHLPELAQTCGYWISDAIQPSHPLSSFSPLAFNLTASYTNKKFLPSSSLNCRNVPEEWECPHSKGRSPSLMCGNDGGVVFSSVPGEIFFLKVNLDFMEQHSALVNIFTISYSALL